MEMILTAVQEGNDNIDSGDGDDFSLGDNREGCCGDDNGDDTIDSGAGNDVNIGDNLNGDGAGGDDVITSGDGDDKNAGDNSGTGTGTGGDDVITSGDGDDITSETMKIEAGIGGNDIINLAME